MWGGEDRGMASTALHRQKKYCSLGLDSCLEPILLCLRISSMESLVACFAFIFRSGYCLKLKQTRKSPMFTVCPRTARLPPNSFSRMCLKVSVITLFPCCTARCPLSHSSLAVPPGVRYHTVSRLCRQVSAITLFPSVAARCRPRSPPAW